MMNIIVQMVIQKKGADVDEMEWNEKGKGVIWLQEKDK